MNFGTLAAHAESYLALAIGALAAGTVLGVPLGIAASRLPRAAAPLLGLANIGRVVPSLAVLTFILPVFGVGFVPALIALTLLALAPVTIAVHAGLGAVPLAARDAAAGLGMSPAQLFRRVEWPLAFPVVYAGIRTAGTEVIASAVLASFVGAGGLGDDIQSGLQGNVPAQLWSGVGAIAAIAIAAEALFALGARKARVGA